MTSTHVLSFVVPLTSAAGAVAAEIRVDELRAGTYANVTNPTTASHATVFAARALSALAVTATAPAMNALRYGDAVTLGGSNLDLLPSRLLVGPVVVDVAVAANLQAATFSVPSAAFAWTSGATVAAAIAARASATHKLFVAAALAAANGTAAVSAVGAALSAGAAVPLRFFNIDFASGRVLLNAELAAPGATVTVGGAPATVPAAPAAAVSDAAGTTSLAIHSTWPAGLAAGTTCTVASEVLVAAATANAATATASAVGGSWNAFSFAGLPSLPVTTTDASPTGTLTAAAAFNATIVAVNAALHTNYTVTTMYTAPGLSVSVTLADGYKATVAVAASGTAAVAAVQLLAYTDTISSVGFATQSATAGCTTAAANRSVACNRAAGVTAASALTAALSVKAPGYFRRDVVVRLHVTSGNAPGIEARLRLQRTVAATASVFFDRAGSTLSPVGSAGTDSPAATPAPAEQALSSDAAARGVFSLTGGCAIPKLPVVWLVLLAALLLVTAHLLHRAATRAQPIHAIAVFDVPQLAGLLSQHAWVGAVAPCHSRCGATHAAQLLVHVLTMAAVAAALLVPYFELADADASALAVFAAAATLAAAATRAFTGVPFGMYRIADDRAKNTHRREQYRPQDLTAFGIGRCHSVGLSRASRGGFTDVNYVDDSGSDDARQPMAVASPEKPGDPTAGVTIVARPHALVGFAVCAVLAVGLAAATMATTAPWCGRRIAAFERTLLAALTLDVLLTQPTAVLCVWLWRWMVSEEEDGRAVHDLHPIDGYWRVVGTLDELACDDDDDDDGTGLLRPAAAPSAPAHAESGAAAAEDAAAEDEL
jgi:hypothetical protein